MAYVVNCPGCRAPYVFHPEASEPRWSLTCAQCSQLILAPVPKGYKYVEGHCNQQTKIYRLKASSGWFTCKCCNFEYTIDLEKCRKIGGEKVFCSERTIVLCEKKRTELKNLEETLAKEHKLSIEIHDLEEEVTELEIKLAILTKENTELAEKLSKIETDENIEKAEAIRKMYLQQIETLHSETGDGEMSDYERKMLTQLSQDLLQLKISLENNTKLNKERVNEYVHFCTEIATISTKDENLLEEIDELEAYVDVIRAKLNKISDEHKAILRAGDISMVTVEYEKELKQKEADNAALADRLEEILGEVAELHEALNKIKEETDEKWTTIFNLVKKEETEQRAAEEKRMETSQQRLLNLTLDQEED